MLIRICSNHKMILCCQIIGSTGLLELLLIKIAVEDFKQPNTDAHKQ